MKDNIVKHRWILLWGKKEVSLYYQNDIWSLCDGYFDGIHFYLFLNNKILNLQPILPAGQCF